MSAQLLGSKQEPLLSSVRVKRGSCCSSGFRRGTCAPGGCPLAESLSANAVPTLRSLLRCCRKRPYLRKRVLVHSPSVLVLPGSFYTADRSFAWRGHTPRYFCLR